MLSFVDNLKNITYIYDWVNEMNDDKGEYIKMGRIN